MNKIITSNGIVILIDGEDYEYLNQWKWGISAKGYAYRKVRMNNKHVNVYMHKDLMNVTNSQMVDHINHDKLDNRKENLRLCTLSQNNMNRKKTINKYSSKYKGVSWCKAKEKWKSRLNANGKSYSLGYHDTEERAAMEYNTYAYIYHGEFAVLNKIGEEQM